MLYTCIYESFAQLTR